MPEQNTGSTMELETPADLKKRLDKLEAERAKDKKKIADLEQRNGVQAKALVELADRVATLTKNPKEPTANEIDNNNDQVRSHYNSGAKSYAEGVARFRNEQSKTVDTPLNPYEELGKKLQEAGVTDENGPANEEEYYSGYRAGDNEPPAPPAPGPHNIVAPNPGERNEAQSEVHAALEAQENLREQARRLEEIVTDFARKRVERERMFSGGQANSEMQLSAQELNGVFGEWSASLARLITEQNRAVYEQSQAIRADLDNAHQELRDLEAMPEESRPSNFDDRVREVSDSIRRLENQNSQYEQLETQIQAGINAMINEKLMEVRARVDFEMTTERERRHPKLAKVGEWLRKHKKTRIVAGVAMTGLGFVGAATGNLPLLSVAVAGKAALRGFGGYTATKAGGEWLADRGFNKTNIDSIEDYTDAAQKQSRRKRRWSRGAAVVGAGLAAAPLIGNVLHTETPPPSPEPPAWLTSREFAEMVHHPNTFQKFMSWTESMKAQGWTDAKIAEALSKLPPAPEGFGS